jgi:hypothetical protein
MVWQMADHDHKHTKMPRAEEIGGMDDRGGRRRLPDRRRLSSSEHFPERRNLRYQRNDCGCGSKTAGENFDIKDRGGRRRLADRRLFSSSDHFPERRHLRHRRSGNDRRKLQNQKIRLKLERRRKFKEKFS